MQEWKEALEEAEKDVKSCIGLESIVWGLYEDEWWPARVLDIDHLTSVQFSIVLSDLLYVPINVLVHLVNNCTPTKS